MAHDAGRIANVSAALLLGGASSRMGCDKASLEQAGVPLAVSLSRLLASLFDEVLLIGGAPPAAATGRRVADTPGPRCALRGVLTALEAARLNTPRVLVVATDLPALTPALLLALVALPDADVVLPRTPEPQPLCAIYRRAPLLARARARLETGALKLQEFACAGSVSWLEGDVLDAVGGSDALLNINTPEAWRRFRQERERPPA